MSALRYGLPALLAVIAVVLISVDRSAIDGFAMLIGAAIAILFFNVLFRFGASGDKDRRTEADARDYYAAHGHWPDEKPGA